MRILNFLALSKNIAALVGVASATALLTLPASVRAESAPSAEQPSSTEQPATTTPSLERPDDAPSSEGSITSPSEEQPATMPSGEQSETTPSSDRPAPMPRGGRPAPMPPVERPATAPSSERPASIPSTDRPATTPSESQPVTTPSLERPGTAPSSEGSITSPTEEQPATTPSGEAGPSTRNQSSIVDIAAENNSFTTLTAALKAAGLSDTLSGQGPFTVFAPTDAAFAALPTGTLEKLLLPENKDKLIQVLTYHVVPGSVTSGDLESGNVDTVEGSTVMVNLDGDKVMVNQANVIKADIQASNGIIHAIDQVILPPDLMESK